MPEKELDEITKSKIRDGVNQIPRYAWRSNYNRDIFINAVEKMSIAGMSIDKAVSIVCLLYYATEREVGRV